MKNRAKSLNPRYLGSALALLWCLTANVAAAQTGTDTVAGLEMDVGGDIDARLRGELEEATTAAFTEHPQYTYVAADVARPRLSSIVRGCFTSECLVEAGRILEARLGLGIQVGGEAQIYDWQLELYDLATGETLLVKRGTCELCGRAEVVRNYSASMRALLNEVRVPELAPTAPETPEVAPAPQVEAMPEVAEGVEELEEVERGSMVPEGTPGAVRLRVSVVPADTLVYVNDELVGDGDVTVWVDHGRHDVRFVKEGYRGLRETLIVGEGSPETIMLRTHLSQSGPMPTSGVPLRDPGLVDRLEDHRDLVGWSSIGVGAIFLFTGAYLSAIHGSAACNEGSFAQCPDIYNTAAAGITLTLTGAALMTAGTGLVLWDVVAGPSVGGGGGGGGAGVSVRGRF